MNNRVLLTLVLLILFGIFFYTYRLRSTQVFFYDTARDTLQALEIWQQKKLTLIGAPASFGQQSTRLIFFGSFYLYAAILGLLIANWDPTGAVYANAFFYVLSIPFFYYLAKNILKNQKKQILATILFVISPVTVYHARFFWNPNLIIPLSVFFWLLLERKTDKSETLTFLFAGIILGIIVNLHYLAATPLLFFVLILLVEKKWKKFLFITFGLLVASSPLIYFELKHNFYLTNAIIFNIKNGSDMKIPDLKSFYENFFSIFWAIIGLTKIEKYLPLIFNLDTFKPLLNLSLVFLLIYHFYKKRFSSFPGIIWLVIVFSLLLSLYWSSNDSLQIRHLFGVYPLLIIFIINLFWVAGSKLLVLAVLLTALISSFSIINFTPSYPENFLSLDKIEQISQSIISDNPDDRYNITENMTSDSRATTFRYFLTRGSQLLPESELSYKNLSKLYVVSPSLEKIYQENRWEFNASPGLKLSDTKNFGTVRLYIFQKD